MAAAYPDDINLALFVLEDLELLREYGDAFIRSGITDSFIRELLKQGSETAIRELRDVVVERELKLGHCMRFLKSFEVHLTDQQIPLPVPACRPMAEGQVDLGANGPQRQLELLRQSADVQGNGAGDGRGQPNVWPKQPPTVVAQEVRDSDVIFKLPIMQQKPSNGNFVHEAWPSQPVPLGHLQQLSAAEPRSNDVKAEGHAGYQHLDSGMPPPPYDFGEGHPQEKVTASLNVAEQLDGNLGFKSQARQTFERKRKLAVERFKLEMQEATHENSIILEAKFETLLASKADDEIKAFQKKCGGVPGVDRETRSLKTQLDEEKKVFRVSNQIKIQTHRTMLEEEAKKLLAVFAERQRQLLKREDTISDGDFASFAAMNLKFTQDSFRQKFNKSPLFEEALQLLLSKLNDICPLIEEEVKEHNLGIEMEEMKTRVKSIYETSTNDIMAVEDLEPAHKTATKRIIESCKGKEDIYNFADMPTFIENMKKDKTLELEEKHRRNMEKLNTIHKLALETYQQRMQDELGVERPVAKPVLAELHIQNQELVTRDLKEAFAKIQHELKNAPQQLKRCVDVLAAKLNNIYTLLQERNEKYHAAHRDKVFRVLQEAKAFCAIEIKRIGTPNGYQSVEAILAAAEKDFDKGANLRLFEPRYITNARDELLNFTIGSDAEEPELSRLVAATEALESLNLVDLMSEPTTTAKIEDFADLDLVNNAPVSSEDNTEGSVNDDDLVSNDDNIEDLISEDSFEAVEDFCNAEIAVPDLVEHEPEPKPQSADAAPVDLLISNENRQLQLQFEVLKRLEENARSLNAQYITFFAAVDQNFSPQRTLTEAACQHLGTMTTEDLPVYDERAFTKIATTTDANGVFVLLQPFLIKNHKSENVAVFILDAQADTADIYTVLVDICLSLSSFTILALSGVSSDIHWNFRNSCVSYGLRTLHFLIHDIPLTGRELNTPAFRDTYQTRTILVNSPHPNIWEVVEQVFPACNGTSRCFLKTLSAEEVHKYFDMHIVPGIKSSIASVALEVFDDEVLNKVGEINNLLRRRVV